jgi:Na+-driven multidrug efflux pump
VSKRLVYWLLTVPFVATLVPPFYARRAPELFGFPFFYWYQILWIVLAALIVFIVYLTTREPEHE